MGTVFSFDIRDPATPAITEALHGAVAWLHQVDAVFSPYRPDSAVSRLDRGETTVGECDPLVAEVLTLCERAERTTNGCFSTRAGGRLDPSGLVKGWAVERAAHLLYAAGARNTCVNGGGDLQLTGEASPGVPWRVGIADPLRPGRLLTVVTGRDLAVATSGTAERGLHVHDPRTGAPARHLLSATVIGPSLTWADTYATAALVMGPAAEAWIGSVPGYELAALTPAPPPTR
ncbi:FAD:protein FMN transferase [Streptomyces palmae]|uniref:FAD:protein FMN transferase n=2 Tax=Streptomyces palmae TaxID=1701085 RepID=A0A4Z0GXQ7_9ACTN|nr:FAD:protein FMN transferase [Streptomyces palmae]TGB01344.1 FAD:protein FMN transferase [Streptomyces palmae]